MRYPAPSQEEIAEVESALGFLLPTALVSLYALRGNGGFGPDYGLLGLASGHVTDQGDTALDLYRTFNSQDPDDSTWSWPKPLLPILHLGCSIYYCIDLASPGHPLVKFDPNGFGPGDNWSEAFTVAFPELEPWLGRL